MTDTTVIYVCGGRSFYEQAPGRKISEVVRCWRESGVSVHHVCGGDIRLDAPARESSGHYVRPQGHPTHKWLSPVRHSLSEYRDMSHDQRTYDFIKELAQKESPQLIWERSSRLHSAGLRVAQEFGLPYVLEWKDHLVDYPLSLYRRRALRMETRKNQECDWMVVESKKLKHVLANDEKVDPAKILVAHNAVDADEFTPMPEQGQDYRRSLGIGDDVVLIGYLGSYAFYHDARRLVLAAKELQQKMPGKFCVVMIGDGKEHAETRALAEQLDLLGGPLRLLPRVGLDEVPQILSGLDIAVLPGSTDIICPIKIQEYMASQTATVAPDYACNREVIKHGIDGILFQPNDEKALAETIIELVANSVLRSEIAKRGRMKMIEHFSWQATWGQTLETILATHPSSHTS